MCRAPLWPTAVSTVFATTTTHPRGACVLTTRRHIWWPRCPAGRPLLCEMAASAGDEGWASVAGWWPCAGQGGAW
jgi:hypothetical protein